VNCDLVLRGGWLVDPASGIEGVRDLAVQEGRVSAVAESLGGVEAEREMDVSGRVVVPGLIDTHVHVGGRAHWVGHRMVAETGVTTVLDMGSRMADLVDGVNAAGAGMNVGGLLASTAAFRDDADPAADRIASELERELEAGALGLKVLGGHVPLTPEATARCIEVANRRGVYVAYHLGTTRSSSNLHGVRELPELLGEAGRVHVAHVAAYCRGMVETPLRECEETLAILGSLGPRVVSESYLSTQVGTGNATSGLCRGDQVEDHVTRNCLAMRGYGSTREALRQAMLDGYCSAYVRRGGRVELVQRSEAVDAWEQADTRIGVSFPVTPAESSLALSLARDEHGDFAIEALATDGGAIPRNYMVERGLALVRVGGLCLSDYVRKASLEPARMLGLPAKGRLDVGADSDITVLDPERGRAIASLVAGEPIMLDGTVVGSGGILLVTETGAPAAERAGLPYRVFDTADALMYQE
jgi:cytosine/adenosine deaminase-related metal-dependent hydrolase